MASHIQINTVLVSCPSSFRITAFMLRVFFFYLVAGVDSLKVIEIVGGDFYTLLYIILLQILRAFFKVKGVILAI